MLVVELCGFDLWSYFSPGKRSFKPLTMVFTRSSRPTNQIDYIVPLIPCQFKQLLLKYVTCNHQNIHQETGREIGEDIFY